MNLRLWSWLVSVNMTTVSEWKGVEKELVPWSRWQQLAKRTHLARRLVYNALVLVELSSRLVDGFRVRFGSIFVRASHRVRRAWLSATASEATRTGPTASPAPANMQRYTFFRMKSQIECLSLRLSQIIANTQDDDSFLQNYQLMFLRN